MSMNVLKNDWYVIYTKPRHEKKVAQELSYLNCQHFLPTARTLRSWQGKKKYVNIPLFPSYVFVKLDSIKQYLESLQIPGVLHYVRIGNKIEVVGELLINKLKTLLTNNRELIEVSPEHFEPGQIMEIKSGPFMGYTCEVIHHKGKNKILVRIELLQRSILLDLGVEDLVIA